MQCAPQASDPDPAPATAFQQQKLDLLRRASRKAPLTTQPRRCQYVREGETDHIAQVSTPNVQCGAPQLKQMDSHKHLRRRSVGGGILRFCLIRSTSTLMHPSDPVSTTVGVNPVCPRYASIPVPMSEYAQKPIELDDDLASAMAALVLSMRGPGAVGTTAMECRSVAPTTLHNIIQVNAAATRACFGGFYEPS